MAAPTVLVDTTFTGKDINVAASVYEYTALANTTLRVQVCLAAVAGGGDYVAYLTLNDGDAVADLPVLPKTTMTAAAGETAFWFASMSVDVMAADVINVFVDGLAGDTNEAGSIRIFGDGALAPTVAGRTLDVASSGEAGLDFANINAATAPTTLTNIVVPNVTTVTGNVNGDVSGNLTGDVFGDVQGSVLGNVTNILGNVNGKVLGGGVGVISATGVQAQIPTDGIGAAQIAATAAQEIADQVWDEALAGHALVGSTGEALTTAASASGATPASLWAYATRTLTQSAAQVTAAIAGSQITILRGDTVTIALTGLGALTGYVSLDWTVKADVGDTDATAILRVRKNASGLLDGLITLNGAAGTAAQANIAINNAALGNITITLTDDATAALSPRRGLVYDVQMITATTTLTMTEGDATITGDVTRTLV